jgi:hypothetical protein
MKGIAANVLNNYGPTIPISSKALEYGNSYALVDGVAYR